MTESSNLEMAQRVDVEVVRAADQEKETDPESSTDDS